MEKTDFVIFEKGSHETLACPKYGCLFDIDAYTQENMVFDKVYMGLLAKCPDCGALQKAEDN